MSPKRLKVTFLLLFVFLGLQAQIKIEDRLQSLLDSLCVDADYPGATLSLILSQGNSIELAYGFADVEEQIPMPVNGRMFSGSTGKTFASAIVMQLIDEGKLDVDDYVKKYFRRKDWFKKLPNASTMKIRQLLNHTSGLPRYAFKPEFWEAFNRDRMRNYKPEELLSFVAGDNPVHPPGEGWGYSDTGYLLLGLIIEKVTGNAYYKELEDRILKPFKLENTSPSQSRKFEGLVQGYTGDHVEPFDLPPRVLEDGQYIFNPEFEYTGGGVVSNSPDLARWIKLLYEGEVFSSDRLKELLQPVDFRTGKPSEFGYGYGVFIYSTPTGPIYGHGGFFFGYQTELLYLPDLKCAIAFQINADQTCCEFKMPTLRVIMTIAQELRKINL